MLLNSQLMYMNFIVTFISSLTFSNPFHKEIGFKNILLLSLNNNKQSSVMIIFLILIY